MSESFSKRQILENLSLRCVIVKGFPLPPETRSQYVYSLFQCQLAENKGSRWLVLFRDSEQAEWWVTNRRTYRVGGRILNITPSTALDIPSSWLRDEATFPGHGFTRYKPSPKLPKSKSPSPKRCSIRVSRLPSDISADLIGHFFEFEEKTGGGNVVNVDHDEKRNIAIVTFQDPDVVKRVLYRQESSPIILSKQQLEIEEFHPSIESENNDKFDEPKVYAIRVTNLPPRSSEEEMELFFENHKRSGGGEVERVEYDEETNSAVVWFKEAEVIKNVLHRQESSPLMINKQQIKVEEYQQSTYSERESESDEPGNNAIRVTNLPQTTSAEQIELFFENRRRSGGEGVERVEYDLSANSAIVWFEKAEVVRFVLKKQENSALFIDKRQITVEQYFPPSVNPEISTEDLLQHMKTEMTTVRHARGIVVGCGGAGKTTLLYSLMSKNLDEIKEIKSTRGLQVYEHIFSVKDGAFKLIEDLSRKPLIRVPKSALTVKKDESEASKNMVGEDSPTRMKDTNYLEEHVESNDEEDENYNPHSISDKESAQISARDPKQKEKNTQISEIIVETLTQEVIKKILDAQENEISVSMIDFAGQFAYYACHQIYMTSKAFYILVMDMTKEFNEVICDDEELRYCSPFSKWTSKDYIEFWLNSIKSFGGPEAPILIVATHAEGKTDEQKENFFERLWSYLSDEDTDWLSKHSSEENEFAFGLLEMNRDKIQQQLQSLKDSIVRIVSQKLETKIKVRSSWALLEHLLQDTGKRIISCDEIRELNRQLPDEYRMESIKEIPSFLSFFHDHGLLLYFKEKATQSHAILGIQWFSDASAKLIADKSHINEDCKRKHIKEWNHFDQTGELNSKLVDALWKEKEKVKTSDTQSYKEYKHELMAYMERLRMLVSIGDRDEAKSWYVPCMNKRPFEKNIIRTNSARSSILCFRFSSFAMFVFYRLIAYCIGYLEWDVASYQCGKCLFQTAALFEYKNHTVALGICSNDIQIQVVIESLDIKTKISFEVGRSIHKALEELTKTFENKNLSFQRGYKCQKLFCNQNDTSFTPVGELGQLENEKIQCSCCPVGEKHIINVQETRRFWEQENVSPAASGQDRGRSRFAKLGMAIYDVLNQACRDILEMEVPPSDIENKVKAAQKKLNLNTDQEDLLKKAIYSGYKSFDISLIYTLIRNICSKIPKPTKGKWGGMPATGEVTVGDDVERIRSIRNKLCAHVSSAFISQTDFDDTWTTMSDICQRLEISTGKKYLDKLNEIEKLSIKETVKDDIIKKFQKIQKTWESFNSQMQEFEKMLKP